MSEAQPVSTNRSTAHPPPGTPCIVDVFAKTTADGKVEFSHEWRWENGPSEGHGTIKVPTRLESEPGTPIHFHLRDETKPNRGFTFAKEQGAAMWVQRGSCPSGDERCDDSEFPPDQMDVKPKLLKAHNLNSEECTLHYRLWVEDKEGYRDSYDPDVTNGGKTLAR